MEHADPTDPGRKPLPRYLLPFLALVLLLAVSTALFGRDGAQRGLEGAITASVIIPGAIGLSLLYGIRKFANFAHGELMALGGYTAFFVNVQLGLDLAWGFLLVPLVLAGVGIVLELVIFSKLAGKGPIAALVASIGLSLILQNLIASIWGTQIRVYALQLQASFQLPFGLTINPIKGVLTISLGIAFMLFVHLLLTRTTLGKAMRATADNSDLARSTGIKTGRVILWTWVVSSALAGVAGILIGLSRDVRPTMGFDLLLLVFAGVILGGIGSAYGAMLGGLVIGLATEMSTPYLSWLEANAGLVHGPSYRPAIAFIIMVIVLLLRPEGILGARRIAGGTGAIRWLHARLIRRESGGAADGG